MRMCVVDNCQKKHHARGWCSKHYDRWLLFGDPYNHGSVIVGDNIKRFWSYVDKLENNGCWIWTGALFQGYGHIKIDNKDVAAHRFSYELLREKIHNNKVLDHLCRNRACVNPNHLEIVTHRTNILRGFGRAAIQARMTHCIKGHLLKGKNLYINPKTQKRRCRFCNKESARIWRNVKRQSGSV